MDKEVISVTLLGTFSMRHQVNGEEKRISERDSTSKLLWSFFQYLTVFHQRGVNQDELIEVLWGDSESANPANTLKTLLHRGRAALEGLGFPDGKQVLLYRRGVYSWSPDVVLKLDIEEFDELCTAAEEKKLPALAMEAIELYQGDFLPSATGSPWAVSQRTFYHTRFLKLCSSVDRNLLNEKRYDEAGRICRHATTIDPFDEAGHLLLMKALAEEGETQAAIQHYAEVADMFMDQLGVRPSEEMEQMYRELSRADRSIEMDLNAVRETMQEPSAGGAFFCAYGVFQDIYRLEARNAARNGRVVQLIMVTILDKNGGPLEATRCPAAMESMRAAIRDNLRSGDTFTRSSIVQHLILLPTASYENSVMVMERILSAYRSTLVGISTSTKYSILPVLPAGDGDEKGGKFIQMERREKS